MTTPHKAMLIRARDALLSARGGRCNAEYNPCDYKEVADALTAAIDEQEPEPVAWLDPWTQAHCSTDYDAYGRYGIPLHKHPPAVREPLTWTEQWALSLLNSTSDGPFGQGDIDDMLDLLKKVEEFRPIAIEAAVRAKP